MTAQSKISTSRHHEAISKSVCANNAFAIALNNCLAEENAGENIFFSPSSVFSALTQAADRTELQRINRRADELRREQQWHEAYGVAVGSQGVVHRLNTLLASVDRYEIRIANALPCWA